jgi:hypothetical protein
MWPFFPLLFYLFLNSINHSLKHARLLAFVDDVNVFYRIDSKLLSCPTRWTECICWANKLRLDFNIAKCHHMTLTHLKCPINFKYALHGTILQSLDTSVTDLGWTFKLKLSHCSVWSWRGVGAKNWYVLLLDRVTNIDYVVILYFPKKLIQNA